MDIFWRFCTFKVLKYYSISFLSQSSRVNWGIWEQNVKHDLSRSYDLNWEPKLEGDQCLSTDLNREPKLEGDRSRSYDLNREPKLEVDSSRSYNLNWEPPKFKGANGLAINVVMSCTLALLQQLEGGLIDMLLSEMRFVSPDCITRSSWCAERHPS